MTQPRGTLLWRSLPARGPFGNAELFCGTPRGVDLPRPRVPYGACPLLTPSHPNAPLAARAVYRRQRDRAGPVRLRLAWVRLCRQVSLRKRKQANACAFWRGCTGPMGPEGVCWSRRAYRVLGLAPRRPRPWLRPRHCPQAAKKHPQARPRCGKPHSLVLLLSKADHTLGGWASSYRGWHNQDPDRTSWLIPP
jgi:hypothetical protein